MHESRGDTLQRIKGPCRDTLRQDRPEILGKRHLFEAAALQAVTHQDIEVEPGTDIEHGAGIKNRTKHPPVIQHEEKFLTLQHEAPEGPVGLIPRDHRGKEQKIAFLKASRAGAGKRNFHYPAA